MPDHNDPNLPNPPAPPCHPIEVILAEYSAMRSEILHFSSMQHNCLGFALTLIGASLAVLSADTKHQYTILLGASIALCCLGIVYLDFDSKILRIAHFIEHHLRPTLAEMTGKEYVLNWEKYFRSDFRKLPTRPTLLGKAGSTL